MGTNLNQTFGSAQPSGFSFSTPTTNTQNFPTNSFNFQSPNFGIASSAPTAPGLSFGALTTKAPAFGTGLSFNPTTSSTAPSFGFGSSTTTPATGTNIFGTTTGIIGTAPTFGVNTQPIKPLGITLQTPSGLGGVDINSAQPKTIEGKNEGVRAKESQVPQPILATVESLKNHIKNQKTLSSDIARTSTRKLFNVANDIQDMNWSLSEISNLVENNYSAIKLLRTETSDAIQQTEMAQRTQETPPGLQFENTAPLEYFLDLIQKYESDLITFRNQVEITEKHMRSLATPQNFTAEDLKRGLQEIHESFIALAGRLHETHQKVEIQKEQYLNLRKNLLRDKTNIFEEVENSNDEKTNLSKISAGPSPFLNNMSLNLTGPNANSAQINNCMQKGGGTNFNFNQGSFGSASTGMFGNSFGSSSFASGNDGFNLQKPPVGTKRNKH